MTDKTLRQTERHACYGGWQEVWEHDSKVLGCTVRFAVFVPPQVVSQNVPVLYWLSGLTCNEQNFITKSGMQRYAAEHGVLVVAPDTSPRGSSVPDDEAYDLGQGAGFYVNATQSPWSKHYQMYDYIVQELPAIIAANFPVTKNKSIAGHSMGGHGALMIALRNPDQYRSVSAFAPIVAPSQVGWGQKAFTAYLGPDEKNWQEYDSVSLILSGSKVSEILVDQGLADDFYESQLCTDKLASACKNNGIKANIRYQQSYDHSYYFIASFIGEHIAYHADRLKS